MSKRPGLTDIPALRAKQGISQLEFWRPYGVTQSAASRYENGISNRHMPQAVAMLLWLHQTGRLTDQDMEKAKDATREFVRTKPGAQRARKKGK